MNNVTDFDDRIAVVGMSGRFPGAENHHQFWRNLQAGVESVSSLTKEDLRDCLKGLDPVSAHHVSRQMKSPNYVSAGFFLEETESFDAAFFGFNPSELELIDPQHRVFMETAWEALEDGGYDPYRYEGRVGVYAGTLMSRYLLYNVFHLMHSERDFLVGIGNESDYLPTRVSYRLNLKGPSVSVQSACSTSLVAIHLACQSLLNGECDMALAGGAVVQVPHKQGYLYQEGSMRSPDGHCRAFDAEAKGTVFSGGGSGTVLLKRLNEALEDGDQIYSVIRGTAINNDGMDKVGYTAPGVDGQIAAITEALEVAGVAPDTISYVEAHGTATPLGDPIEVDALTQAYREFTDKNQYCGIGSVKTNIGHLAAAAGVASLMKVSLAMKHSQIPPSLNYSKPNPRIDFENSPFYVNDKLQQWDGIDGVKRAGISSFGVGGTNAHAVLEQAPAISPSSEGRRCQLISLSAKSEKALYDQIDKLADYLEHNPSIILADLAYTLHVGRHPFEYRFQCVVASVDDAIAQLRGSKKSVFRPVLSKERKTVFMFSGQGSQYVDMAKELYDSEPIFKDTFDQCATTLNALTAIDLHSLIYPAVEQADEAAARLQQTEVTQPALFIVEYSLAILLESWGVKPDAMIGHSIGEWVAACIAGVLDVNDAIRLVAKRASLMGQQAPGTMAAVRLPATEVSQYLHDDLSLAAVNGPELCVLSGKTNAINALNEQGLSIQPLHTSHAFHSAMMESALEPFRAEFEGVRLSAPTQPFISNVTGDWITDEQATDPEYWLAHLRGTVHFADGVRTLLNSGECILLEVGPGTSLSGLARLSLTAEEKSITAHCLPHPKMKEDALKSVLSAVGNVWCAGHEPEWAAFYGDQRRLRISAPTYAFQRRRFWIDTLSDSKLSLSIDSDERKPLEEWFYAPSWTRGQPTTSTQSLDKLVVLHGGSDTEAALISRIRENGKSVIDVTCRHDLSFSKTGEKSYQLDIGRAEAYTQLVNTLSANGQLPDSIIHTLTMEPTAGDDALFVVKADQDKGFYSLIWLSQALGLLAEPARLSIQVVTSGLNDVVGSESLRPAVATIVGPRKVIPMEYSSLTCRLIDLAVDALAGLPDLALLVSEVLSDDTDDVALRNHHRWTLDYQSVSLPDATESASEVQVRENGLYMITGGLGGLGLVHAHKLASMKPSRIVLLGRSLLPPRDEWDALLSGLDTDLQLREKLEKIKAIEAMGSQVDVVAADISDLGEMEKVVADIRTRHGGLNGVVHCAGAPGGGLIQLKQRDDAERVFRAKLYGTTVLAKATQSESLDFVFLASSLFAVSGGIGQVDYCAANNFLDAMAKSGQFSHARKVMSVNWDAWEEVGMARDMLRKLNNGSDAEEMPANNPTHRFLHHCEPKTGKYHMRLRPDADWLLKEHKVNGLPTVPGTLYLEMARAAFIEHNKLNPNAGIEIKDTFFIAPLQVEPSSHQQMVLTLKQDADKWLFNVEGESGMTHVFGAVAPIETVPEAMRDLASIKQRLPQHLADNLSVGVDGEEETKFIHFGQHWQTLKEVYSGEGEALIRLSLDEHCRGDIGAFVLHPALLDVATGPTCGFCVPEDYASKDTPFLPSSYGSLKVYHPLESTVYSHMRFAPEQDDVDNSIVLSIEILNEEGLVLAEIDQFTLRRVNEAPATGEKLDSAPEASPQMAILPKEGAEVFERLLQTPRMDQLIVSTKDLTYLFEQLASQNLAVGEADDAASANRTIHDRPDLDTDYVEPEGPMEKALAAVWQQVLGIIMVGRCDNFFALGADSVLGVQIVSVARENGITITPGQLFEHQTIAELALVAEGDFDGQFADDKTTSWSMTEAQRYAYHLGVVLVLEQGEQDSRIESSLRTLIGDAPCLQYRIADTELAAADPSALTPVVITSVSVAEVWQALDEALSSTQDAPVAAGYINAEEKGSLFVLFRGELVDATTATQLKEHLASVLAGKAKSPRNGREGYAAFHRRCADLMTGTEDWPTAWPISEAGNTPSLAQYRHALAPTFQFPEETLAKHQLQVSEVVLAALGVSVREVIGQPTFSVTVAANSRTVTQPGGWEDTMGNLAVTTDITLDIADTDAGTQSVLTSVKDAYRQQCQAHLNGEPRSGVPSPLLFDADLLQSSTEGHEIEPVAFACQEKVMVTHPIQLRVFRSEGCWTLAWLYDGNRVNDNDIQQLNNGLVRELNRNIDQLVTAESVIFTPTDFPDAGLNKDTLNSFMSGLLQRNEK